MLARFVLYRRANKRRKESDLLALLARWSAKLGSEFFCLSFVKKIDRPCTMMVILTTQELILPKREIKDDVSVEG